MRRLLPVARMVVRRSLGHWRLAASLAAGVVLASALMASVFLYSDAIRDLGLKHALEATDPLALDLKVLVSSGKLEKGDYDYRRATTDQLVRSYAGDIVAGSVRHGLTSGLYLTPPGQAVPQDDARPRSQIEFHENLMQHAKLVEGREPRAAGTAPDATHPANFEAMFEKSAAAKLGVKVGDTFDLHSPYRKIPPMTVTVVGLLEATDAGAEYWGGAITPLKNETTSWPTYLFQVDESAMVREIGGYMPDLDISIQTVAMVDAARVNSGNSDVVEGRVRALGKALNDKVMYSRLETKLPDTIANYRQKLFFTRLPLFVLMLQVVGVVLFYVVMAGSMVVERQAGEIALLKSRGASTFQVVSIFAAEALALAGAAVVLGPLVATAAIALLGLTPPFHDLSHGELLRVPFSWGAIGMAALGSALAFLAILWPVYRACRYSITHYKQEISRPQQQPAFFRYHLDLVVAVAGAFAFYELRQNGSFATEDVFGGLSVDPVRLATPSLLLLFTALVFLRLFPLGLAGVSWLARSLRGPTIAFGLARMVRAPVQHSRLILLLILTTAVGVFAAGFRATLEQGYHDRAAYRAGAEVRIQDVRKPYNIPLPDFKQAVAAATGSQDLMAANRQDSYYNIDRFKSVSATVLSVDPDQFGRLADWRGDFGDETLASLVSKLKLPPASLPEPAAIPADARFIGVWASIPLNANAATPTLRLRDESGIFWEYRLATEGTPAIGAWAFYSADLSKPVNPRGSAAANALPKRFEALYLRLTTQQPQVAEQYVAYFDDLQTTAAATLAAGWGAAGLPVATIVDPLDDVSRFELITGTMANAPTGQITAGAATGNRSGSVIRLSFQRGPLTSLVAGLRRPTDSRPVPVVADSKFLAATSKKVGDEITTFFNSQYVRMKIVGTYDLLPTYDPTSKRHLLLADFSLMGPAAVRAPGGADGFFPNEAWLGDRSGMGLTKESLLAKGLQADQVVDRVQVLADQSSDPLVAASWEGILFLCFAAVLLLSALGFVMHAGLSAQARSLEFAIVRTMGMSVRQIVGVVSFEQLFVIVSGVVAGTILGFPLSELMIDSMGITENGVAPIPPLVSRVGADAIVTVYVLLGIVVATTSAVLVLLFSRLAVSRALRMGEL